MTNVAISTFWDLSVTVHAGVFMKTSISSVADVNDGAGKTRCRNACATPVLAGTLEWNDAGALFTVLVSRLTAPPPLRVVLVHPSSTELTPSKSRQNEGDEGVQNGPASAVASPPVAASAPPSASLLG